MVWVDVSLGERELVRYQFDPRYPDSDPWRGLELRKEHRGVWNLYWKKTFHNECTVCLVLTKNIVLGDNDWDNPVEALRYSC